jgi:hypothetical protein
MHLPCWVKALNNIKAQLWSGTRTHRMTFRLFPRNPELATGSWADLLLDFIATVSSETIIPLVRILQVSASGRYTARTGHGAPISGTAGSRCYNGIYISYPCAKYLCCLLCSDSSSLHVLAALVSPFFLLQGWKVLSWKSQKMPCLAVVCENWPNEKFRVPSPEVTVLKPSPLRWLCLRIGLWRVHSG